MEVTTNNQTVMAYNLNPKKFNYGEVVYWVGYSSQEMGCDYIPPHIENLKTVLWGTVIEHYCSEIAIARYMPVDERTIDGVPAIDVKTPTKWRKLPKGWSYDTVLFTEKIGNIPNELHKRFGHAYKTVHELYAASTMGCLSEDEILDAIKLGLFQDPIKVEHADFRAEITKDGWRIKRKYRDRSYRASWVSVPYYRVYKTRSEAQKELDDYIAELKRKASLSDREWSIELIDRSLEKWKSMYCITNEDKNNVRDRLLALDNIEEIEVRLVSGHIEWKYDKNKRWIRIDPE